MKGRIIMEYLKNLYLDLSNGRLNVEYLKKNASKWGIYPRSIHITQGSVLFLIKNRQEKMLVIFNSSPVYQQFIGSEFYKDAIKICPLNSNNSHVLRKLFPFTSPVSHADFDTTIGLGDRLGIASPAHIRIAQKYNIFPVLAQQSIRELNLTSRTFEDILNSASWAVFQEDYQKGFGADGDHLKTIDEVKMAIDNGFTMITLDCSKYIHNEVNILSQDEINSRYYQIEKNTRNNFEEKYLHKSFTLNAQSAIYFNENELKKIVLIYNDAIKFTIDVYNILIKPLNNHIDFEMSIDETSTPTSPAAHYFVAKELIDGRVDITSLAPRFCGKFEKGIDYIGDIDKFKDQFHTHVSIAKHFGYKISIHSGSDKFSIFHIIGKETNGKYHLKTAGTNWLQAMKLVAYKDAKLYREIHKFALDNLKEAKKYYVISADTKKIPDIDALNDSKLPELFDLPDCRQVIHITYGLILQAKNPDGSLRFKNRLYDLWYRYEEDYNKLLEEHIGKHLNLLEL